MNFIKKCIMYFVVSYLCIGLQPMEGMKIESWMIDKALAMGVEHKLYSACEEGGIAIVLEILNDEYVDINKIYKVNQTTPLYAACWNEHKEIVAMLLSHNDIDINKGALTPLYAACEKGNEKIVAMLLSHNDIDINKGALTSLYAACGKGNEKIVAMLLSRNGININKGVFAPLYAACGKGNEKIVEMLLSHNGIDVNKVDLDTSLYIACEKGHEKIVEMLLSHDGIDINKADLKMPLYAACKKGNETIIKMLLKRKDINTHRYLNFFVRKKLSWRSYRERCVMLIENGLFDFSSQTDFNTSLLAHEDIASSLLCKIKMLRDLQDKCASCFLTVQAIKDYFFELAKTDTQKDLIDKLNFSFKTLLADDSKFDMLYDLYIQGTFSEYIRAFLKNKILSSRQMKLCEIYMKETKQQGGAQKKLYDCCQENMEKLFKKYPYFKEWFAQMLVEYQRSQKLSKTRDVASIRKINKNMVPDVKVFCVI